MIGFATRFAIGGAFRTLAPLLLAGGLAVGLNTCTSRLEAAGAAKYRAAVLTAIGKDNAAVAARERSRADAAEQHAAERRATYEANEAVYRGRIAALRSLPPEQEGFQCPEPDEWRLLRHCPYYSP